MRGRKMMPVFSIKHEDPHYPGFICTADWDEKEKMWVRTIGLSDGGLCFEYTPLVLGLDSLSFVCLLSRFGLLQWRKEIPILELGEIDSRRMYSFRLFKKTVEIDAGEMIILRMSPAQLIAKRREKEMADNGLPRLEVATDNLDIVAGKGRVLHYAEEYDNLERRRENDT